MSWSFDLASYDEVRDNAEAIYERLSDGSMPCDGPWLEEKSTTFRAWMDAGTPAGSVTGVMSVGALQVSDSRSGMPRRSK